MIRISYKDNYNWTDINGNVQVMIPGKELYKARRVQPNYSEPVITTDTWNGKTSDVQHIRYDAWYLEFYVKESELNEVSRLQSCAYIRVYDLDNNLDHMVDMSTSELFEFAAPVRIADTSNWKISFVYRINRTPINKGLAVLNTNVLTTSFDDGVSTTNETFYTDFPIVLIQEDTAQGVFSNERGYNTLSKAISKGVSQIVFYLENINANTLKKEFERAQTITLNTVSVLENDIIEYSPIGEGLIKCVVSCLVEVPEVSFPLNV